MHLARKYCRYNHTPVPVRSIETAVELPPGLGYGQVSSILTHPMGLGIRTRDLTAVRLCRCTCDWRGEIQKGQRPSHQSKPTLKSCKLCYRTGPCPNPGGSFTALVILNFSCCMVHHILTWLSLVYFKFRCGTTIACRADFGSTAFKSKRNFWAIRVKYTHATYTLQYQDTDRTYRTVRHFTLKSTHATCTLQYQDTDITYRTVRSFT